jgi:hypothetical protein
MVIKTPAPSAPCRGWHALYSNSSGIRGKGMLGGELTTRRQIHGYAHEDTVHASFWLAQAIFGQNRHIEARDLWKKAAGTRLSIDWDCHPEELHYFRDQQTGEQPSRWDIAAARPDRHKEILHP